MTRHLGIPIHLLVCLAIVLAWAPSASAYRVLLDIDLDGDAATINESTDADSATVKLVLWPTVEDEWIPRIEFGMGGTCWDCINYGATFGTKFDLPVFYEWLEHPLFASSEASAVLCSSCCGNPYYFYEAIAAEGGFTLSEPIFLRGFEAWVSDSHIFDHCPHPPADLLTLMGIWSPSDEEGNEIQIGTQYQPVQAGTWSTLKSLY